MPTRFFVAGLPRSADEDGLRRYFEAYGPIESTYVKRDADGNSRLFGWVAFRQDMPHLVDKAPFIMSGRTLSVAVAHGSEAENPRTARLAAESAGRRRRRPSRSPRRSHSRSRSVSSHGSRSSSSSRHSRHQRPRVEVGAYAPGVPLAAPPMSAMAPVPQPPAPAAADSFVCIPMALCPPQYLYDPRALLARLDMSRAGSLIICGSAATAAAAPPPLSGPLQPSHGHGIPDSRAPPPPPPGPPPPPPPGPPSAAPRY